jgi:hypothetical protein
LPSSQAATLSVKTQPDAGSQLSVVHSLLSLQTRAAPPWHVPPPQVSPVVQALPSSQAAVLFVKTQPRTGSHVSVVQGLSSLHTIDAPVQTPPLQTSPVVHALPSLQGPVVLVWTHPLAGSQLSEVQKLPSLQEIVPPGWHVPPEHVSPLVQALPSLQPDPSGLTGSEQSPVAGSHVPASWQVFEAVQMTGAPDVQLPPWHVSLNVHASSSLQAEPFGFAGLPHRPVAGLQTPV